MKLDITVIVPKAAKMGQLGQFWDNRKTIARIN